MDFHCRVIFTYVRTVIKIAGYMRGNAQTEQMNLAQLLPFAKPFFIQWNLDITKAHGLAKCVCSNEVSLYRGSFPYFSIRGVKKIVHYTKDFVI